MDPQTLDEIIRLVKKLSAVHQLTATLTPSTVSMISSVLSVDRQVTLAATALMPSVMAMMNLATFPRTAPTRFLHQEHHVTTEDLAQGINTTTIRGTDHTPILVSDIGDIIADHSPAPVHTVVEVAALEGTPHTLLPATTAAHTVLQSVDAPLTPHAFIPIG